MNNILDSESSTLSDSTYSVSSINETTTDSEESSTDSDFEIEL